MPDLTPEQAIEKLRGLPVDRQRAILAKLSPEVKRGIIDKLHAAGTKEKEPWLSAPDLTTMSPHQAIHSVSDVGREGLRALSNIGAGGLNLILHPQQALESMGTAIQASGMAPGGMYPTTGPSGRPEVDEMNRQAQLEAQRKMAEQGKEVLAHPLETAEGAIGQAGVAELVGPMARSVIDTAAKARVGARNFVTKTGPSVTRRLVADTATENQAVEARNQTAAEVAEARNQERAGAHQEKVQEALHETAGREQAHAQALQAKADEIRAQDASDAAKMQKDLEESRGKARQANEKATQVAADKNATAQSRYEADAAAHKQETETTNHLNRVDREFKTQLAKVEERVHDAADAKYEALKPKLYGVDSDPEIVGNIVTDTIGEMDSSDTMPPLLSKLKKASEAGVLDYEDLDGFRSKLGRELRKGTLPGDVYHTYEMLQDRITDEMTRIASEKGLQKEATAARSAWREWAQAFRDRKSPLRQILKDPEPHGFLRRVRGKEVSGIAAIRQFSPELASAVQAAVDLADQVRAPKTSPLMGPRPLGPAPEPVAAKVTPEPAAPPRQLTSGSPEERAAQSVKPPDRVPIPDRLETVTPEVTPKKVLTPEDVTEAKQARAIKRADAIRNSSEHLATVFVVLDSVQALLRGEALPLMRDITGRVAYTVGKYKLADFIESPSTLKAVGKLTPADVREVMKLPEDQRAGFDQLLMQAQAHGAKLQPGVTAALFGVSAPATVNMQGPKTKELRRLRDEHAYTDAASPQQ